MISQEETSATADRLTDALAAAAAIMPPDETRALTSPVPTSPQVRRRMARLRAWLVPVGAAASVTAIILTALTVSGHPGTAPAPRTAPASAGPGITSLAGVPSVSGTKTPPPAFYVIAEGRTVQVRRTSDGQLTGTMPALPAGLTMAESISVTADGRTFTIAAQTPMICPSSSATWTRFYQFRVTSTGQVTGLRAVGQRIGGEPVIGFAASPDGTEVAYTQPPGCLPGPHEGVIHVMDLTTGAVRTWHNTVSAATPARVTSGIGTLSWTADGRTLAAEYLWKLPGGSLNLAVLGLDATSSGGSLQAHSHLLFSQGARCTVCMYTAVISADGSTLTAAAATSAPPLPSHPGTPRYRLWVLQLSVATGQPSGILYRSAASNGTYNDGGLVPALSADGPVQHWILWNDPEQFGRISGGQLIPLSKKALPGGPAIAW